MSRNAEELIIEWGNATSLLSAPVHANVPAKRPAEFFTVERTGGPGERFRDLPTVAVQAWASTRSQAALLIDTFVTALWSELRYHDDVARIEVNTVSHFPGANGEPRYQAVLQLVTA